MQRKKIQLRVGDASGKTSHRPQLGRIGCPELPTTGPHLEAPFEEDEIKKTNFSILIKNYKINSQFFLEKRH